MTTSESTTCLNCGASITGAYCTECSQASTTRRMTFSRLFAQDFIASVFNLNHGFFRACVDLIIRPGDMIKNYLAGRRKSYFHFAGLALILLAIDALLLSVAVNSEFTLIAYETEVGSNMGSLFTQTGIERMHDFYKFMLAFTTPLLALVTCIVFKKIGYFYAEHIVIAWFYLSMCVLLSIMGRLIGVLPLEVEVYLQFNYASTLLFIAMSIYFYWSISGIGQYSTWSRIPRVAIVSVINIAISIAVPMAVASLFSV